MSPETLDQMIRALTPVALTVGAYFFKELRSELHRLNLAVSNLRLMVEGVTSNREAIADHEQRIRALEKKSP